MFGEQELGEASRGVLEVTLSLCAEAALYISIVDATGNIMTETGLHHQMEPVTRRVTIHHPGAGEVVGAVIVTTGAPHGDIYSAIIAQQIASRIEDRLSASPAPAFSENTGRRSVSRIEEMEYNAIMVALSHTKGAVTAAAVHLGISRSTMYRRLRLYEITEATK